MLLVYTQKVTPRITYSFKFICVQVLGISVRFTSRIEDFVAHEGMKISYGKASLANELFIQNVDLLLEQGVSDLEIKIQDWNGVPCFFPVSEESALPCDIFAAAFFLLSRYEEYLPHVKDEQGRFRASESLAQNNGFLQVPVVDIWALRFRDLLKRHFTDFDFPERKYTATSVVSVTEAYCYRKKGILRILLGLLKDIFSFRPKYVLHRFQVMFRFRRDPYDIYGKLIRILKKHGLSIKFMFQVSDFSTYDRNTNHNRLEFQSLMKSVADYAEVGLQPGYYAIRSAQILKDEKTRLESILKRPVRSGLNKKYNLMLPDAYMNMVELDFQFDYSMGYPDALGFRAGTCTPFLFYDINFEITTPLLLYPYCISTKALDNLKETEAEYKVRELKRQVKVVEGTMVYVFTNKDLSEYANSKRNLGILKSLHEVD